MDRPQKSPADILPFSVYAIAHQLGDGYTGPGGQRWFVDGVVDGPVPGHELMGTGLIHVAVMWDHDPDCELVREDGQWCYRERPVPVDAPPLETKPMVRARGRRKRQ